MTNIFENYEIKNESTFKIGGKLKKAAFPTNTEEFVNLLKTKEYDLVLGGCSNVLFSSSDINKNIIFTKNINDYKFEDNKIYVSAGTRGPLISKLAKDNSLTGFEFLIGFPGTFGGMVTMNASAHNQEIADNFISARVFDIDNNQVITLNKEQMNFGYRNSKLSKEKLILLDAVFELKKGEYQKIDELMNRNIEFRKLHQPSLTYGNAGSIFKNPQNDSAGRLLDLCEMKGKKQGNAMVFQNHANFVINIGNATSKDVITLMYEMYTKVREKYTIALKPEIKFIEGSDMEEIKLWEIMTKENI